MNFYENSYFYHFSMPGGAGNPPGGSGDTRDRFYINKKKCFFLFFLKFHKYFAYKRTLDGLKSRFDPLEL